MTMIAGSRPFNGLSPFSDRFRSLLNAMADEIIETRAMRARLEELEDKTIVMPPHHNLIDVLVTGYMLVRPNVWWYAWVQAHYEADSTQWTEMPGGLTSTIGDDDFAIPGVNGIESGNGSGGIVSGGVDQAGADYPAGFDLVALRGEGAVQQPDGSWRWDVSVAPKLTGRFVNATDSRPILDFSLMNQHDGLCAAASGGGLER